MLGALILSGVSVRPVKAQDVAGFLTERINALRASQGLNTLNYNGALAAAAQAHSQYLASTPYAHPHRQNNGSLPQDRAAAAGYSGRVGENVVGGGTATLEWAYNWWLNSPTHYNNMLGSWTDIGVGFSAGTYGKWYVVVFGDSGSAPARRQGISASNPGGERAGAQSTALPPRPTRPPTATSTPTITLTPSHTFTPRPTFTPTDTPTLLPATATPILIAISTAAPDDPAPTPLKPTAAPPTAAVIAAVPPEAITAPVSNNTPTNPLRAIIPLIIVLNALIIGALALGSRLKRRP